MKILQGAGNALVGLLVPQINANASARRSCVWYSDCWQCGHKPCAYVCNSNGCSAFCNKTC